MRIALIPIYVTYYESVVPGIRDRKTELVETVREFLTESHSVVEFSIVTDLSSARDANQRVSPEHFDCVVIVPLVAVFAQLGVEIVRSWEGPLLLLSVICHARAPGSLTMPLVVSESQSFGSQAIANAWMREGVPFTAFNLDIASAGGREQVQNWLCVHECVRRIRNLKIGLIGEPFPAMTDVELPESFFERTGASLLKFPMSHIHRLMRDIDENALAQFEAELRSQFAWAACSDKEREFSLRCGIAVPQLLERESLDCAAFNSHGADGLGSEKLGVMAALAVTLATSAGRPVSEVGDLCTAFALWLGRQFGGACYYTELDSAFLSEGTWLLLNSGEFDLAWTSPQVRPSLIPNTNFSGVNGRGLSFCVPLNEGPATILNFSPIPNAEKQFRILFCEGYIAPDWHPEMGVPNARFQVRGDASDSYHLWLNAGPVHHSATVPGHIGENLRRVCAALEWQAISANV